MAHTASTTTTPSATQQAASTLKPLLQALGLFFLLTKLSAELWLCCSGVELLKQRVCAEVHVDGSDASTAAAAQAA